MANVAKVQHRHRRFVGVLVAGIALLLLSGCQVRTGVDILVREDGSGVVTVSVGLDAEAIEQFPDFESMLRLDDLAETGWTVAPLVKESDGISYVRISKPFTKPEEVAGMVAEVAGENGPFQGFNLSRESGLYRTNYEFSGAVDFSQGLDAFADQGVNDALAGSSVTAAAETIAEQLGQTMDDVFVFRVAVGLPGEVSSNATESASNGAVWQPRLSEARVVSLNATSDVTNTRAIVLTAIGVVAGIAALILAFAGFRSRRGSRPARLGGAQVRAGRPRHRAGDEGDQIGDSEDEPDEDDGHDDHHEDDDGDESGQYDLT